MHPDLIIPFLDISVSIDILAAVCIFSDLLIVFILYVSLVCLEHFLRMTKNDVKEHMLTASDFSICFRQLPPKSGLKMKELKAYIWIWAENILKEQGRFIMLDPKTATTDLN